MDILVEVSISVSNEGVKVSVGVTCLDDIDDEAEYSFEVVIASIVFNMFVRVVLEISSVVADIN